MGASETDTAQVILILTSFPVYFSVQTLARRLLISPYSERLWGSWLIKTWTASLVIVVIQFPLGTIAHLPSLGRSFLGFGLPALAYSLVLLYLVRRLLPAQEEIPREGGLLHNFRLHHQQIYFCVFLLAAIPLLIAPRAFGHPETSPPQVLRYGWLVLASLGVAISPHRLWAHKALVVTGGAMALGYMLAYGLATAGT